MGITSSLVTALSGLSTAQQQIDVVGNNIANVNTIGYKATTIDFKTQFLQNFSYGSAPTATTGGTNPLQIGLGATSGAITTDFGDGSLQTTGVATNLAIQGNGFFVLNEGISQVYTRDGTFQLNNKDQLVSSTGQLVQGYSVDSNFNVIPGVLGNVTIPLGAGAVAQATTTASFKGNLNSSGTLPTSVSQLNLGQPFYLAGAGAVDPTNPPTATTLLTNVTDASNTPQFQVGDILTLTAKKGSQTVPKQTLTVTSTTTVGDLQTFFNGSLGINTTAGVNSPVATAPGASLTTSTNTATLSIAGNPGTANDLTFTPNSFTIARSGTTLAPYTFASVTGATGESVTTTMTAYDSLGTAIPVNVTAVLTGKTSSGSTWQFFATSPAAADATTNGNTVVGSGTLTFDTAGNLVNASNNNITVDRTNTGAVSNLTFALDFSGTNALTGTSSSIGLSTQDGAPSGNMTSFSIGNDGTITGSYSNGISRIVGQVALATFQNDEGLINDGNNTYSTGPNSGTAIIGAPQSNSAGKIVAGSLEGSNVDLSSEFVKMISASTAFSASSRVITSSNQLLQDLLSAAR